VRKQLLAWSMKLRPRRHPVAGASLVEAGMKVWRATHGSTAAPDPVYRRIGRFHSLYSVSME